MAHDDETQDTSDKRDGGGATDINFTTTGDGTAWDSGRTSSIARGSAVENDLRSADAEAPGVPGPKPGREDSDG